VAGRRPQNRFLIENCISTITSSFTIFGIFTKLEKFYFKTEMKFFEIEEDDAKKKEKQEKLWKKIKDNKFYFCKN
jgi:hypothetical protein